MNNKFRGWDAKLKKMFPIHVLEYSHITGELLRFYGNVQEQGEHGGETMRYGGEIDNLFQSRQRYLLMRCTGLQDINYELVYEKDIVDYHDITYGNIACVVVWDENTASFCLEAINSNDIFIIEDECCDIEIIGNIYENSSFLEGVDV